MQMRSVLMCLGLTCGLYALGVEAVADSKSPSSSSTPKPAKSNTAKARDRVAAAQREYTAAVQRFGAARAKLKETMHQAPLMREDIRSYHDSSFDLQAARSASEQSRQDLEQASRPLLEKIHQGSDYQAAVARRDELKKKLQSLPAGVPALREELEHELALATAKVRKTEKSQLKADADTQDLLKDVDRDEAELRRLIRHRDGEVVRDPRLATALGALTQAKTELLEAQQAVADREGKLAAAQEDLSRKTATQKPPKHRKRHR